MRHVDDPFLRNAAVVYGVGLAVHTADHFRRGFDVLTTEVLGAGYLSTAAGLVVIVLVARGHRLAPVAAVLLGFNVAIGVAAVHLLPEWSTFSDAFPGGRGTGVTVLSWAVVLIEIAGAVMLGLAGASALRRSQRVGAAAA